MRIKMGPTLLLAGIVGGLIVCYRRGHLGIFKHRERAIEMTPDPWTDKLSPPVGVW
jgi:hypothetical protein